jgi:acyl-homoserine lactone acylase PvdQ
MIVAANNKVIADDTLGYYFAPGLRAKRIIDLLSVDKPLTMEDMKAIQGDVYSLDAEIIRPYLLRIKPENNYVFLPQTSLRSQNSDSTVPFKLSSYPRYTLKPHFIARFPARTNVMGNNGGNLLIVSI